MTARPIRASDLVRAGLAVEFDEADGGSGPPVPLGLVPAASRYPSVGELVRTGDAEEVGDGCGCGGGSGCSAESSAHRSEGRVVIKGKGQPSERRGQKRDHPSTPPTVHPPYSHGAIETGNRLILPVDQMAEHIANSGRWTVSPYRLNIENLKPWALQALEDAIERRGGSRGFTILVNYEHLNYAWMKAVYAKYGYNLLFAGVEFWRHGNGWTFRFLYSYAETYHSGGSPNYADTPTSGDPSTESSAEDPGASGTSEGDSEDEGQSSGSESSPGFSTYQEFCEQHPTAPTCNPWDYDPDGERTTGDTSKFGGDLCGFIPYYCGESLAPIDLRRPDFESVDEMMEVERWLEGDVINTRWASVWFYR